MQSTKTFRLDLNRTPHAAVRRSVFEEEGAMAGSGKHLCELLDDAHKSAATTVRSRHHRPGPRTPLINVAFSEPSRLRSPSS